MFTEFKYIINDGRLEELDVLVKPIPSDWPWKPVPDIPSTIDTNVTVEDCVKAIEDSCLIQWERFMKECPELAIAYQRRK